VIEMITEWVSLGIQFFLAIAAILYTIETRRMRLQNEEQMRMLRAQTRRSIAPYLVPSITDVTAERNQVEVNKDFLRKVGLKFICEVKNLSYRIAINCSVWVYDKRERKFLGSCHGRHYIDKKGTEYFLIAEPYLSRDKVLALVKEYYGEEAVSKIAKYIKDEDSSYILLLFQDLEDCVYCFQRQFEIDDNGESIYRKKMKTYLLIDCIKEA